MDDTKNMLQSKTVWGVVLSVAGIIASQMHIDIGDASGWVETITALIGAGLALYGRVKAVKRIG